MKAEFSRLIDDTSHSEIESVLRTGIADDPSAESIAQAARVLGLGSAASLTFAASKAAARAAELGAGAGPCGTGGAASTAGASGGVLAGATKWLVASALVGAITAASLVVTSGSSVAPASSPSSPSSPPPPRASARPAQGVVTERTADPLDPAIAPSEGLTPARASAKPARAVARPASSPTSHSSLPSAPLRAAPPDALSTAVGAPVSTPVAVAESGPSMPTALDREVELLDEVRRHLGREDPNAALAVLSRHAAEISAPMLGREATLLRVRALVASGARHEAQRLVERTLGVRPVDGYACRMARIAGVDVRECSSP